MNYYYVEIAVARAIGLEEAFGTEYFANDSNHRSRMLRAAEPPIIVSHLPGIVLQIQHRDGMFTNPSCSHNFRQHSMFLSKGYVVGLCSAIC
jgi:hypothetical protein